MAKQRLGGTRGGAASPVKPAKRPYRAPRLAVYGNLRDMTRAKGGVKGDGGGNPATKV